MYVYRLCYTLVIRRGYIISVLLNHDWYSSAAAVKPLQAANRFYLCSEALTIINCFYELRLIDMN